MRSKILIRLGSSIIYGLLIMLGIHNYKKDPDNNLSLATIILFALLIGFSIGTLTTEYVQYKKENPDKQ
jgi:hypothetical protein